MRLKDKVALITGGAQGLGKSIALAMARDGANIVICDLKEDKLQPVAKEIEALGRQCLAVRCDVSSRENVGRMFAQTVERFGTLHILVNNAARVPDAPEEEQRRNRHYNG